MSTGNRRKGQGSSNKVPHNRRKSGGKVGGKPNSTGSTTNNEQQNSASNKSQSNHANGNNKTGNVKLDAKKAIIKTKITIITIGIVVAVAAVFILVTLAISFITAIFVIDEGSSSSDSSTSTAATSDVEVIEYDENNNPIVTYYSPEDYIKGLTYSYIGDNTSEEVYKVYAVVFRNVVTLINKGDINKEEYNFAKPSTIPANSSSLIGSAINSVNKEILKDENNDIIKPKINTECTSSDIEQCPTSSGIALTIVEDLIVNNQKNLIDEETLF